MITMERKNILAAFSSRSPFHLNVYFHFWFLRAHCIGEKEKVVDKLIFHNIHSETKELPQLF